MICQTWPNRKYRMARGSTNATMNEIPAVDGVSTAIAGRKSKRISKRVVDGPNAASMMLYFLDRPLKEGASFQRPLCRLPVECSFC